jgi:hypothetical protein
LNFRLFNFETTFGYVTILNHVALVAAENARREEEQRKAGLERKFQFQTVNFQILNSNFQILSFRVQIFSFQLFKLQISEFEKFRSLKVERKSSLKRSVLFELCSIDRFPEIQRCPEW